MSKKRGPFTYIIEGRVVKVYLGDDPNDPETEFVTAVDAVWIPALIATLKEALTKVDA